MQSVKRFGSFPEERCSKNITHSSPHTFTDTVLCDPFLLLFLPHPPIPTQAFSVLEVDGIRQGKSDSPERDLPQFPSSNTEEGKKMSKLSCLITEINLVT